MWRAPYLLAWSDFEADCFSQERGSDIALGLEVSWLFVCGPYCLTHSVCSQFGFKTIIIRHFPYLHHQWFVRTVDCFVWKDRFDIMHGRAVTNALEWCLFSSEDLKSHLFPMSVLTLGVVALYFPLFPAGLHSCCSRPGYTCIIMTHPLVLK